MYKFMNVCVSFLSIARPNSPAPLLQVEASATGAGVVFPSDVCVCVRVVLPQASCRPRGSRGPGPTTAHAAAALLATEAARVIGVYGGYGILLATLNPQRCCAPSRTMLPNLGWLTAPSFACVLLADLVVIFFSTAEPKLVRAPRP